MQLPAFAGREVFVKHEAESGVYFYKATAGGDGTLTFTSRHGFSPFTFSLNNEAAAEIGEVGYDTLQAAVNVAGEGSTITILSGGTAEELTASVSGSSRTFTLVNNTGEAITVTLNGTELTIAAGESQAYAYTRPSGGGGGVATYAVNVADAANGTATVNPKLASQATEVTVTVKPDAGYELSSLTVTGTAGAVEVTQKSDTQYTFKMPGCAVTITAVFRLQGEDGEDGGEESVLPFTDVSENTWYYDAVTFVYNEGMMSGTGGASFAPATNLSRAMIAQVLFNLESAPTGTLSAFEDVASGSWYYDAVNWAAAQSIVTGYGDGTFGPEEDITREQMAAILYRYAQYKEYISVEKGDLSAFSDGDTVSDWAKAAMEWAVGNGVLSGKGNNLLDPTGTASRAEVAQILMNFCNAFVK